MTAIENFLARYDNAVRAKSKEMRLQMDEARELAHELAMLAARSGDSQKQIIELQKKLIEFLQETKPAIEPSSFSVDGGGF
jgi:oligoribonuclease (3'-5' exoribonuclease)